MQHLVSRRYPSAHLGDMSQPTPTHSFCEPSWASTISREHIRRVGPEGIKPGGGIPDDKYGRALCGYRLSGGWDQPGVAVTEVTIASGMGAECNPVCPGCAEAWRTQNDTDIDAPRSTR